MAVATPALIFDFDGTLIDSAPAILATHAAVLAQYGLQPKLPLTRELIGPPLPDTLSRLSGVAPGPSLDAMVTTFKSIYDETSYRATELYPGIASLLSGLQAAGYSLFVATNKRLHPTLLLLDMFGLQRLFAGIYALDLVQPPYQDKATMLKALLAERRLAAEQCLYVGDTCHDEKASGAAGIAFVGVAWGYGVGEQQVSSGAQVVQTATELHELVGRWSARQD